MAIGIGAGIGGVLILIAVILGILWCVKSKRREKERFERTASLRSSMRMSKSTLTMLSEGHSRRRLNEIDGYSQASSGGTKASRGTEDLNGSMASLNRPYRNGRAVPVDHSLTDRRGTERNQWREREREREREMERERHARRGRRYRDEEEEQESEASSRGKEESESEVDKKEFDDSEEEVSSDADPEEEVEGATGRAPSENHLYQNNFHPLPGLGLEGVRRTHSRDDVYENQAVGNSPSKSKSLSSFSHPDTPDESPVANIFLPRRLDLPTPPPTPRSYGNSPNFERRALPPHNPPKPEVGPKPTMRPPFSHPVVEHLRQSPVPSEGSQRSGSGRPSPLPRKNLGGSQGSSPRGTPVPYGSGSYPDYENQAVHLPPKPPVGSLEFLPRSAASSLPDDQSDSYDYKPRTPRSSPSHRLPNLPRYSPPLPMERPPAYEESDQHPNYQPDYMSHGGPAAYIPSQEPPEQDVQYLPRRQPDRRQFHGSRDRLGGSREQLSGSREHLSGSREHLSGSRDRLNYPYSPVSYAPNVLYLNSDNHRTNQRQQENLETEIWFCASVYVSFSACMDVCVCVCTYMHICACVNMLIIDFQNAYGVSCDVWLNTGASPEILNA